MGWKKIILAILSAIIIAPIAFMLIILPPIERVVAEEVVLGAHRGAHSIPPENYTENTLEAFQKALENPKYKFIEFDIQYTEDKQIVVHHDNSLLRLQKKPQWIDNLDYSELLEISDYHIPTYEETMNLVAGKKPLNIEIKSQGNLEDDKKIVEYVITDCKKRGIMESTMISSISGDVILYIKSVYPEVKTGKIYYVAESTFLGTDNSISELYNEIDNANADFVMLHGCNLRNYQSLKKNLPTDKTLVIWYFSDEMYVVQPKTESWVFKLKSFGEVKDRISATQIGESLREEAKGYMGNKKESCAWWCA